MNPSGRNLIIYQGPDKEEFGFFILGMQFYRYDAKDHVVLKESIKPFDDRLSSGQNIAREGSTLPF